MRNEEAVKKVLNKRKAGCFNEGKNGERVCYNPELAWARQVEREMRAEGRNFIPEYTLDEYSPLERRLFKLKRKIRGFKFRKEAANGDISQK